MDIYYFAPLAMAKKLYEQRNDHVFFVTKSGYIGNVLVLSHKFKNTFYEHESIEITDCERLDNFSIYLETDPVILQTIYLV